MVEIGPGATVAHSCVVHGAVLERHALLGNGSTMLDGSRLGEGSMVAAGSLVSPETQIPAGVLAAGTPARGKKEIAGTGAEFWVQANPSYYADLAQRHRARRAPGRVDVTTSRRRSRLAPFGARILGPSDQTARALRIRVQLLLTAMLVSTNVIGAGLVFVISYFAIPAPKPTTETVVSLAIAVPSYVAVAVVVGALFGTQQTLRALRWATSGREPDEKERQQALRRALPADPDAGPAVDGRHRRCSPCSPSSSSPSERSPPG